MLLRQTIKPLLRSHVKYITTCPHVHHFNELLKNNKAYEVFNYVKKSEHKDKLKQKSEELYYTNITNIIKAQNEIHQHCKDIHVNLSTSAAFSVVSIISCLLGIYDAAIILSAALSYNILRALSRKIYIEDEKNKIDTIKNTNKFLRSLPY